VVSLRNFGRDGRPQHFLSPRYRAVRFRVMLSMGFNFTCLPEIVSKLEAAGTATLRRLGGVSRRCCRVSL